MMLCIVYGCHWLTQLWQDFGRVGVWLGLVSVRFPTPCTISWKLGAPLLLLCDGPTPWQSSQGYLFDSVVDHVIFSLGFFSTSVSAQCTGWHRTAWRGRNICIKQMSGCKKKVKLDYKGLDLIGLSDLMGLSDFDGIWMMLWSEILACSSGCNKLFLSSCIQALPAMYYFVCSIWFCYIHGIVGLYVGSHQVVYNFLKVAACARPSRQMAAAIEKQPLKKDFPDAHYNKKDYWIFVRRIVEFCHNVKQCWKRQSQQ